MNDVIMNSDASDTERAASQDRAATVAAYSPQNDFKLRCEALRDFCAAQAEFGPVRKSSTNTHLKTLYADLAEVIAAVTPALNKHNFALMQLPVREAGYMGCETLFIHANGYVLSGGVFIVPVGKGDAQGFGGALTYARRYGLMAAAALAAEDDDGNAGAIQLQQQRLRTLSSTQVSVVTQLAKAAGVGTDRICARYDVEKLSEVSAADYAEIERTLQKKIKEVQETEVKAAKTRGAANAAAAVA
ncbi:ERF family protein [Sinimarinibacterium sp. NLF-5-8]|uniref:ERF family protein n=1 Tax=Sinimarinibacterium sp. NLF-5-8 TaxID=2698684 RepID=UPI00137BE61C|nr:ERF family protein [Sinimarinibacterium sp. NLF-5-8]QHS09030.1 hypothetical protein GT972_01975 [Sinimarinibacterium sp. NLF-5-8]